ncbi:MAG: post-PEP-CTERM-1 domain-containing protein [Pseudomonadota bacterium]|jgi:predicted aspartyl protease
MTTNRTMAFAALLAAALAAQAATAGEAAKAPAPAAQATAGIRVYIDPATGKFSEKPVTDEQRRAAEAGIDSGPLAPMVETRHPDGTVQVDLNGHFEMANMAVVGPDGKLMRVCDDAAHAAKGKHFHPVAAAAQREER